MKESVKLKDGEFNLIYPDYINIDLPNPTDKSIADYEKEFLDSINSLSSNLSCESSSSSSENESSSSSLQQTATFLPATAEYALEFNCGHCCKKALAYGDIFLSWTTDSNGNLSIIRLTALDNGRIIVKCFSDGKLVNKEIVRQIAVPGKNFCSLEFSAIELNPENPIQNGISPITYEINCYGCCKKIMNIRREGTFNNLILLVASANKPLLVKAFAGGKVFEVQLVREMWIKQNSVCSRETNSSEI